MSLRLIRGAHVSIDGKACEVVRRFEDRVQIQAFTDGEVSSPTDAEVDEMFVAGRLVFSPPQGNTIAGKASDPNGEEPDLAALPLKVRRELERRLTFVKPFLTQPGLRRSHVHAEAFLANYPEATLDENGRARLRPKPRTLLEWCERYGRGGPGALMALAPKYWRSGHTRPVEHDSVEVIIQEVLRDTLMRAERPTVSMAVSRIENRINMQNKVRVPEAQLRVPSRATVYRRVKIWLDGYDLVASREGKRAAERRFGGAGRGVRADRPLERVIMDHTVVDVIVVDDREHPLFVGRPTLTVLIDVFSRCIVGFFLSFEPPSFAQAAIALRRAVLPKVNLGSAKLKVKHTWPCSGVIETLVVDNGKEFHSEPFRAACALLNITLAYAPIRKPEWKAIGERFFGSLNTRGIHCIPGTTRSNSLARGEYPSVDKARFTLAEIETLLTKIIVDDYHKTVHSTLGRPPAVVWDEGVAKDRPHPVTDARGLRIALGRPEIRHIRPEGIRFRGLWYQDGLGDLRRRLGNGAETEICVDPLDLGHIHVLDSEAKRFVKVLSEDPDYTNGLPLYSHLRIREEARAKGRDESDPADLAATREEIWQALRSSDRRRRRGATESIARGGQGGRRQTRVAGGLDTGQFDGRTDPASPLPTPGSSPAPLAEPQGHGTTSKCPKRSSPAEDVTAAPPASPPAQPSGWRVIRR